jgi:hypothetical protein
LQLRDYQWSGNPRGMHNIGSYTPLNFDRYARIQLGWLKIVAGGEEFASDCAHLLSMNITPIIRIYRPSPGAMAVDDSLRNQWIHYIGAGAKWFEFYNEPNFSDPEWPGPMRPRVNWRNVDEVIRPLCENWLGFAETIISMGGYPAFPALGETSDDNGAIHWLDALLGYMRDNYHARFAAVANSGLWCATHPYSLNHFYQEVPGQPTVPRPPEQENGTEGGWHFEYPNDPYTQSFDPGRSIFGSPSAPNGDPNGITAMGTAFNQRMAEWFGVGPLPVVGTEGGIYPLPIHESQQPDARFPPYDRNSHAEATVAMFKWITSSAPAWMFGICLWKEDEYYNNQLPAIERLESVPQFGIPVPPTATPLGPGPVHGQPSFHMVILAPGVEPEWFFEAGRAYWNTFRPIVTTAWNFISYIPYDRSLAVTLITPFDMAGSMVSIIKGQYRNIVLDLIVAGQDQEALANTLNARVWSNRPLG